MRTPCVIVAISLFAVSGCANSYLPVIKQPSRPPDGIHANKPAIEAGKIHIVGGTAGRRMVQYLMADVSSAKITVFDSRTGLIVNNHTFTGSSLVQHFKQNQVSTVYSPSLFGSTPRLIQITLIWNSFDFELDNLPVFDSGGAISYQVKVDMFLDPGATVAIGSSISSAFTVSSTSTTTVNMPVLTLAETSVGNTSASLTVTDNPAPAVNIK